MSVCCSLSSRARTSFSTALWAGPRQRQAAGGWLWAPSRCPPTRLVLVRPAASAGTVGVQERGAAEGCWAGPGRLLPKGHPLLRELLPPSALGLTEGGVLGRDRSPDPGVIGAQGWWSGLGPGRWGQAPNARAVEVWARGGHIPQPMSPRDRVSGAGWPRAPPGCAASCSDSRAEGGGKEVGVDRRAALAAGMARMVRMVLTD